MRIGSLAETAAVIEDERAEVNAAVREQGEQRTVLLTAERECPDGVMREIMVVKDDAVVAHARQFDGDDERVTKTTRC